MAQAIFLQAGGGNSNINLEGITATANDVWYGKKFIQNNGALATGKLLMAGSPMYLVPPSYTASDSSSSNVYSFTKGQNLIGSTIASFESYQYGEQPSLLLTSQTYMNFESSGEQWIDPYNSSNTWCTFHNLCLQFKSKIELSIHRYNNTHFIKASVAVRIKNNSNKSEIVIFPYNWNPNYTSTNILGGSSIPFNIPSEMTIDCGVNDTFDLSLILVYTREDCDKNGDNKVAISGIKIS